MTDLIQTVKSDAEQSANRWDAAIESDDCWSEPAEKCASHYDAAIEAIEAGDLETAEAELERANALESSAGDNCDAHHALKAVRAAQAAA